MPVTFEEVLGYPMDRFQMRDEGQRRPGPATARGEKLEPRLLFATFTVLNTADSGVGSLRQALADAASSPGADEVHFAIPGAGVHTIHPLTPLVVSNDLSVDGTTQPGFTSTPMIELSGDLFPPSDHFYDRVAFDIQGSRTAISGLAV